MQQTGKKKKLHGLSKFFSHENTSIPPSLSKDGKVRSEDKADLLDSQKDVIPMMQSPLLIVL